MRFTHFSLFVSPFSDGVLKTVKLDSMLSHI
jgi:hypothetical protein